MYELPDFSGIEKILPWGVPTADPVTVVIDCLILLGFFTLFFIACIRFGKWLNS